MENINNLDPSTLLLPLTCYAIEKTRQDSTSHPESSNKWGCLDGIWPSSKFLLETDSSNSTSLGQERNSVQRTDVMWRLGSGVGHEWAKQQLDLGLCCKSESGKTLWFWIIQLLKYKIRECCNKEKTKISQKTDVVLWPNHSKSSVVSYNWDFGDFRPYPVYNSRCWSESSFPSSGEQIYASIEHPHQCVLVNLEQCSVKILNRD